MTTVTVMLLIASGALMILEILVPSFGMLGLLSATAYVFAVVLAFKESTQDGLIVAAIGLAIFGAAIGVGLKFMHRTPFGRKSMLDAPTRAEVGHSADPGLAALVDATGTAITDLRPAGRADVGGRRLDVVANSSFIARGATVRVVQVEGSRIVVEPG